jgi:hypothetical protein
VLHLHLNSNLIELNIEFHLQFNSEFNISNATVRSPLLLLSGACVSVDMRAIESVSFAISDFKLSIRAPLFFNV